jgi:hypothetical protein
MFQNIKTWFLSIWEKVKTWLITNWFTIVNYIVIFIVYSLIYGKDGVGFAELLLGLWLFTSAAYGGYKWFMSSTKKDL